jgi:hypothetical protein
MEQVAVNRTNQRAAVVRHCGNDEQPHALQSFANLHRADAAIIADDVPQVSARPCGAAVEQFLKAINFLRSLQHVPIRPQPSRPPARRG